MAAVRVIIAGGGTGGHLYPGIAVAEELVRTHEDSVVGFVGTAKGIEARVIPAAGYPLSLIDVVRLKGGGPVGWIRGLLHIPRALWQSWRILRRFRPDVVVGVGGYASGPLVLAASLTGRPTMVLEQNAVAGLTNRILGRFADAVVLTFEQAKDAFPLRKVKTLGNPIRRSILEALSQRGDDEGTSETLRLLVVGGSGGAKALNETVPDALARLNRPFEVLHQTGRDRNEAVEQRYAALGIDADVRPYIDDMARAYRWCDLAVCRAGATTVCELAVASVPSILIPFPQAADDHQTANAKSLETAGAAVVMAEAKLTPETLAKRLDEIDPETLREMARSTAAAARPQAATAVVDLLLAMAAKGGP